MPKKTRPRSISYDSDHSWKRRPSEIHGYLRTLYVTTDDGDYLRVDYNTKEKRVRLYVEAADEGGNAYYAVITNGKVTAEKSVSTGRASNFSDKFEARAEIFSTIPNDEVLKLINRNFSISLARKKKEAATQREREREEVRKKYFREEQSRTNPYVAGSSGDAGSSWRPGLIDIVDMAVGITLSLGTYILFSYSYVSAGVVASFYGIILGLVDLFIRERAPVFTKILLFLGAGSGLYIYGYFF